VVKTVMLQSRSSVLESNRSPQFIIIQNRKTQRNERRINRLRYPMRKGVHDHSESLKASTQKIIKRHPHITHLFGELISKKKTKGKQHMIEKGKERTKTSTHRNHLLRIKQVILRYLRLKTRPPKKKLNRGMLGNSVIYKRIKRKRLTGKILLHHLNNCSRKRIFTFNTETETSLMSCSK